MISFFATHPGVIKGIIALFFISLLYRLLLQSFGQQWITTIAHTGTLFVLPLVTFVITKVISGNIALSLGMVGALSIVRFRNPVRSPLELSVYFVSITNGIAASVGLRWLFILTLSILLVSIFLYFINIFFKKFLGVTFVNASFSEGNSLSVLEVMSKAEISDLDQSEFLSIKEFNNNRINYVLCSSNYNALNKILDNIKNNSNIINYQIKK